MGLFEKVRQKSASDYKVIELEAQNVKIQFDLVETLKSRIHDLERENGLLRSLLVPNQSIPGEESFPSTRPTFPKGKRRVMSIGEMRRLLEEKSREKISVGREINEDEVILGMP